MIVQRTEGSNAQVKALVLKTGIETEMYLRHTAAQHHLVVGVYFAVGFTVRSAYVLIEAVANPGTLLSSVVVQVFLRAGNTLICPAIELTYFLAYIGDVCSGDVRVGTKA